MGEFLLYSAVDSVLWFLPSSTLTYYGMLMVVAKIVSFLHVFRSAILWSYMESDALIFATQVHSLWD